MKPDGTTSRFGRREGAPRGGEEEEAPAGSCRDRRRGQAGDVLLGQMACLRIENRIGE